MLLLCIIRMHCVHHVRGGADDVSGLLIAALTASTHTPIGRGSEDLDCKHLPFDDSQGGCCWLADAAAMPTGVGLTSMQLRADTDENARACVGGLGPYPYALLLRTTSEQQRAAAVHHSHVHRVHHVRGGADDVSELLIAARGAAVG